MGKETRGHPQSSTAPHDDDTDDPAGFPLHVVLYSSDLDIPAGHKGEIVTTAGSGAGSPGGGATTTLGSTLVTGTSGTGLTFNLTWDSSVSTAPTGFTTVVQNVAQYYANHFSDPITVNINVGYGESGGYSLGGALGMSVTYLQSSTYSQIKNALTTDNTTAADASAVASLLGDPTGGGHYWVTTAEAKALGLSTSTGTDGFVGFSSSAGIFDYDNTNNVSSGQYDFFAVVAHEFSEVMGRMLLVGSTVGGLSKSYDALDLFHYSAPGVHDLSGSIAGYFSTDNGTTNLHNFNVSPQGGDRGDWASSATSDAFDAFGTPGVVEPISSADLTALDVIGWNAGPSAPPPPLPDLTATNLILNATATGVTFQLGNIGTAAVANAAAGVYLSSDSTITTSDVLLGSVVDPSLSAGASHAQSVSLTLLAQATSATYYLGVVADPGGAIAENSESNNVSNVVSVILGTGGANSLNGTSGNNIIFGFGGNDTIMGGGGNDVLTGGTGSDHFVYAAKTDGLDTIVDFTPGSDVIDFARSAFGNRLATGGANTGTLDQSHFIANSDGHATRATALFIYNTTSHVLSFDSDGTGGVAATPMALLVGVNVLSNSDLHLV